MNGLAVDKYPTDKHLSLIHISEPTRQAEISYAVFCLKKKTFLSYYILFDATYAQVNTLLAEITLENHLLHKPMRGKQTTRIFPYLY